MSLTLLIIERLTYEVRIEEIETKGIGNILRIMRGTKETFIIMRSVANVSGTQSLVAQKAIIF